MHAGRRVHRQVAPSKAPTAGVLSSKANVAATLQRLQRELEEHRTNALQEGPPQERVLSACVRVDIQSTNVASELEHRILDQIEPRKPHETIMIRPRRSGFGTQGSWIARCARCGTVLGRSSPVSSKARTCSKHAPSGTTHRRCERDACVQDERVQSSPCMHERVSLYQSMLPVHEITSHLTSISRPTRPSTCSPRPAQARVGSCSEKGSGAVRCSTRVDQGQHDGRE